MTPASSSSAYVTPAEFLLRKDIRPTQEIVLDDPLAPVPDLTTNAVLLAILMQASGMLESAVAAGSRYKVADLQALMGTNAGELIKGIVSDLAAHVLSERRWQGSEDTLPGYQAAIAFLQSLREGDAVLPFVEVAQASVPESYNYTQADIDALGLPSGNIRAFGIRGRYGQWQ